MKFFLGLLLLPVSLWAQPQFEVQEFSAKVVALQPGFNFAYSRIMLQTGNEKGLYLFHPINGELFVQKAKPGAVVEVKAKVYPRSRELMKSLSKENQELSWYLSRDEILEIKFDDNWVKLKKPEGNSETNERSSEIFLEKEIRQEYFLNGQKLGLVFDRGAVAYVNTINPITNFMDSVAVGDKTSFVGLLQKKLPGYVYPIAGVKQTYFYVPLRKESGRWQALLFKQNHVCIGAKFKTNSGKEIRLSFPSDHAIRVREFLKPEKDLRIYFGRSYNIGKMDLPELHAIIQEKDTLYIKEFGFYGGADGNHEHEEVEIEGKITRINKSEKGNVMNIIVDTKYYVEIDAMMAQQLGYLFKKGKSVIIAGKERIKKVGEIYNKNYQIITPEKISIDGKTFSAYTP
ncbi:MAG: hypothetical protein JSS79_06325 [Bacteroidetes bacterium]|nr:hypothetical protein [Bacteroidota bacterium]